MLSIFMSESKFYVYSKDGCGFCDKLTNFMESKGVEFEKFDLGTDFSPEEFLYKYPMENVDIAPNRYAPKNVPNSAGSHYQELTKFADIIAMKYTTTHTSSKCS